MSDSGQIRVALLGATFVTGNMGVSALASSSIKCILSGYPRASVSLLDYSRESSPCKTTVHGNEVQIPFINIRFSKKFYLPNNIAVLLLLAALAKAIPSTSFRRWIGSQNNCFRKIDGMDLFVSIAGGDSFSDIYGLTRFFYISLPQILVLLMGKRLVLLPQTIGPFDRNFTRSVAKYILKRAERVYSRDERSLSQMQSLVSGESATQKFAFCYDVAFVLDPAEPSRLEIAGFPPERTGSRPLVGLNASGLLAMGGYTRNNMFGLQADYAELMQRLIDFLILRKGADVLLVPHVFGADPESDVGICERLFEALKGKYDGRLGVLRGNYDQSEIKYVIGRCDFFVGSRMHACIAAISQGEPAVCIAYSDKFIGVMETLGIESLVVDARRASATEILQSVDRAFSQREFLRRLLEAKMPEVKKTVLNLFAGSFNPEVDNAQLRKSDSLLPTARL